MAQQADNKTKRVLTLSANWSREKRDAVAYWEAFYRHQPHRLARDDDELPQRYAAKLCKDFANENRAARLLEYGCGAGQDVSTFSNHGVNVTGVDVSESALLAAQALCHKATFLRIEAEAPLPFADEYFDAVYSRNVLSADFDELTIQRAIDEWWRVLAPGALLLLTVRSIHDDTFRRFPKAKAGPISLGDCSLFFFSRRLLKKFLGAFCIKSMEDRPVRSDKGMALIEVVASKPA